MSGLLAAIHQHHNLLTRNRVDRQRHIAGFGKIVGDGGTTSFSLYAASNVSIRSGDAQKDKRAKVGIVESPPFGVVDCGC